jgi:DNA excision repair protein ERCC-3
MTTADRPLVVQSDGSLLLDVHDPSFDEARSDIARFSDLEKSPEHIHTFRISPLSLWNAASAGLKDTEIIELLNKWSKYPVPDSIEVTVQDLVSRFGLIRIRETDDAEYLLLEVDDEAITAEIASHKLISKYLTHTEGGFFLKLYDRGTVKQLLIKVGYPVQDIAPLADGEPLAFQLAESDSFEVRDYQKEATSAFTGQDKPGMGFGTVVMPCGSGKTIVGIATIHHYGRSTLILTTNVAAVHQWIDELTNKTDLKPEDIGEYSGDRKEIRPITIATYQILTWRPNKDVPYPHFRLFHERAWGLIVYDEVHLLPAPIFRVTAEIQSVRRLGLTATLVREDGKEDEVFSLVGPKRYDVPWKELEQKGWIAEAYCHEIRIDLPVEGKIPYATADKRQKFRIAAENPLKSVIVRQLIDNHREDLILVIGQYIRQLEKLAALLKAPLITGKTPNKERERIYSEFRTGKVRIIVVSKVANFAIDLPDASVAIQVSGTFGSRQEEAQRLGRILRPKKKNSYFYSIVSRYTTEELFATNRQKFLTEQGYKYQIEFWDPRELADG